MRRMSLIASGALALGAGLATSSPAFAQEPPAPPPPAETPPVAAGTSTTTLPLLGAPLTVDVTTDAGGGLLEVSLGSPDDFVATGLRSNKVSFTNETTGTSVKVSTRHGSERIVARAGSLADIVGPGTWSGDVFGTGAATTVSFEIVDRGDGTPDVVGVTVAAADGTEFTIDSTEYWAKDGRGAGAVAEVDFTSSGQRRTLTINASSSGDADGESRASLRTSLSRARGAEIAEGAAVGPHTWTGDICGGPAQIDYVVTESGEVTDVAASPEAQSWTKGRGAWVAFSRREAVAIHVGGPPEALEVRVSPWIHCDRSEPAVNTEVAPDARDDDRGDRWKHGPDDGWFGDGWDHRANRVGADGGERGWDGDRDTSNRDKPDHDGGGDGWTEGRGGDGGGRGDRGDGGNDGHDGWSGGRGDGGNDGRDG